jgi:hypothetical protein
MRLIGSERLSRGGQLSPRSRALRRRCRAVSQLDCGRQQRVRQPRAARAPVCGTVRRTLPTAAQLRSRRAHSTGGPGGDGPSPVERLAAQPDTGCLVCDTGGDQSGQRCPTSAEATAHEQPRRHRVVPVSAQRLDDPVGAADPAGRMRSLGAAAARGGHCRPGQLIPTPGRRRSPGAHPRPAAARARHATWPR